MRRLLEADTQAQRDRERREHKPKLKDLVIVQAIRLNEVFELEDVKACKAGVNLPSNNFDVTRDVRLVPPFRE